MGSYTAISLGVSLKKDTPQHVINAIRTMVGETESMSHPSHTLFDTDRWKFMFVCDSYYFDYQTNFTFTQDYINKRWYLSGVSNLKNYNGEIDKFLDWIQPHLETEGFIGWTMYEEDTLPTWLVNDSFSINRVSI